MAAKRSETQKKLEARAKKLARKFVEDAQALFDDEAMTGEVYDAPVMQALTLAQSWAEDVEGAE